MEIKISIIIPVYNTEKFLQDTLDSVFRQTLQEIEIICVNDGSTDNSQQIIDRFTDRDPRFISINQENHGAASARNKGMLNAHGEVIMFMDSDDFLSPNACEVIWKEYKANDPDIIVFGANIVNSENAPVPVWLKMTLNSIQKKTYTVFTPEILFYEPSSKPFVWNHAYRNKLLKDKNLIFQDGIRLTEDMCFCLESFPHADRFSFIPDKLYNYRWGRSGSVMDVNSDLSRRMPLHFLALDHVTNYWYRQGWLQQYWRDYLPWFGNFVLCDITQEEPAIAREHLVTFYKIVHHYELEHYIETLSEPVYSLLLEIEETISQTDLPEDMITERLRFQMRLLRLQMQKEMNTKWIDQLKTDKENMEIKMSLLEFVHRRQLDAIYSSASWKIGNLIIQPLHLIKTIIKKQDRDQ